KSRRQYSFTTSFGRSLCPSPGAASQPALKPAETRSTDNRLPRRIVLILCMVLWLRKGLVCRMRSPASTRECRAVSYFSSYASAFSGDSFDDVGFCSWHRLTVLVLPPF